MAVVNTPQSSTVALHILTGQSASGANVYKSVSFANVKTDATDENVFAVAHGIAGLQKGNVTSISRASTGLLANA